MNRQLGVTRLEVVQGDITACAVDATRVQFVLLTPDALQAFEGALARIPQ